MVVESLANAATGEDVAQAIRLLRAGKFEEGRAAAARLGPEQSAGNGHLRLLLAIADLREGAEWPVGLAHKLIREGDVEDVLRLVVGPWIEAGRLDGAIYTLGVIIDIDPSATRALRQRANLHGRIGEWEKAIVDADAVAAKEGDEMALAAQIQYRILGGKVSEAAALTDRIGEFPRDERLLSLMILALIREGRLADAADMAERVDPDLVLDTGLAGNIVQALFRAERHDKAIAAGEAMLAAMIDGVSLRSHLAQAWFAGGAIEQRFAKAIEHLEAGVRQAPKDVRMLSMLGDLLLRSGKTDRAIPYLRQTLDLKPELSQVRALYARALKQAGHYAEAADEFMAMTGTAKDRGGRWQRYAAGALSQAGRKEEAAEMFDAWVSRRRAGLPYSFGEGLNALWDRVDQVNLPKARLDWAWSLRDPACALDRQEWERRAKWGHLADHYLLDWLECRDDLAHEAMHHFADELDRAENFLVEARARAPGKGVVCASAHVGAMYFGPLALELIGERSRWLASTPSVARTAYAETLISTSDQTDIEVAKAFMHALRRDYIVVVVADGAINLAAPRIPFEGQEITFSQFSARTAHRIGSSSAFVAPVWRPDNHLGFMLEHLPMPEEGEEAEAYGNRWQEAYLNCLRKFLSLPPENLRLSGGIWRHIR